MTSGGFESLVANEGSGNRMQVRKLFKLDELDKLGDAGGRKQPKYALKMPAQKKPGFDLAFEIGQSLASAPAGGYGAGFGTTPARYAGYDTGRYL